MLSSAQEDTSAPSKPVKYGELFVLGCNGSLPNGDKDRRRSRFALCRRNEANGVRPGTVHASFTSQAAKAVSNKELHRISFRLTQKQTVVVEYTQDRSTDMFQIGRSTEDPIDFVVSDLVRGEPQSNQSTVSRFSCRILCSRNPPHSARIYAAGFDSSNHIFLGEKSAKWRTAGGQMDALTTNGVLVMKPRLGFCPESKVGLWREISVCGEVFSVRETRSAQQRGERVSGESNELVDGTLVDLCGVTLLWRSPGGLSRSPTDQLLEAHRLELNAGRPQCPVGMYTLSFPGLSRGARDTHPHESQPWVYVRCGHVHGYHGWGGDLHDDRERECPMCRTQGKYVPLWLGLEAGFYVDSDKPTHALVPCGHVCSKRTALYWSHMHTPHMHTSDVHGFQATCPFCLKPLDTQTPFIHLIFQSPLD